MVSYLPGQTRKKPAAVFREKVNTYYWRASETLTGVTQLKIGDVCLFIYMFGRMYVILYLDPPHFCVRSVFDPVPNFTKQNPPV